MKQPKRRTSDPSFLHILMGEPDDQCEVCRAHGLAGHDLPDGAAKIVVMEMGPLDEILRCSCPLCSQLQFEAFEGSGGVPPDDDPEANRDP